MKKRKTKIQATEVPQQNPVAKFAHHFNKTQTYADKTQYRRQAKHRNQEVSVSAFLRAPTEAFC
jgi:hypothetical protein